MGPLIYAFHGGLTSLDGVRTAFKVAWGFATPPGAVVDPNTGGRACAEPCGPAANVIQLASIISWVTLAGLALLLVALRLRGRLGPATFAALGILLVCVDLFHIGMGYNPAIDRKYNSPPATAAIQRARGRIALPLREHGGHSPERTSR